MGIAAFRRFCLAVGQRLVDKGQLERPDDVFYLYRDELREAVAGGGEWREPIAQRRAALEEASHIVPPDHLG